MMFKVISMHTKPLKHAKYNEILTNTFFKNTIFEKLISRSKVFQKIYALRISEFACAIFSRIASIDALFPSPKNHIKV